MTRAASSPSPDALPGTESPQRVARYARRAEEPTIRGQDLAQAGLTPGDTMGIIDVCLGLSINDAYWVVPEGFAGTFAAYNLFDNELDEALALTAYTGYPSTQHRRAGLSTEWTTDGQYPKTWRRIDDALLLFKAGTEGYANSGMEPYSEFFAAQAAEAFGIPPVDYDLEKWLGKLASVCPLIHDKDTAFVPFWPATGQSRFPANLAAAARVSPEALRVAPQGRQPDARRQQPALRPGAPSGHDRAAPRGAAPYALLRADEPPRLSRG